jgi:uncharacterized protein YdhG (YjbR/CyaY superfamily)
MPTLPTKSKNGYSPYWETPGKDKQMSPILEYILSQPDTMQPVLMKVYSCIKDAIPDTEERISWAMPTFWKGRNIIHFAAAKHHIGLYPGPDAIVAFAEQLRGLKTSKGAIQFPIDKPLPVDLIVEIARWSYEHNKK